MDYNRTTWQDSPSTSTPINAANLNNIESGLATVDASLTNIINQPIGTVTTNYTIGTADVGKFFKVTGAAVINVPTNATAPFSIGQKIDFVRSSASAVSFSGTTGVTVNATPSTTLRAQYSAATLVKTDTNEWYLIGDLL